MPRKPTTEEEKAWQKFEREQAIEFEKMIIETKQKKPELIKTNEYS